MIAAYLDKNSIWAAKTDFDVKIILREEIFLSSSSDFKSYINEIIIIFNNLIVQNCISKEKLLGIAVEVSSSLNNLDNYVHFNFGENNTYLSKNLSKTIGVKIFPNVASAERPLCALAIEQNEEWITGRKYLNMEYLKNHS